VDLRASAARARELGQGDSGAEGETRRSKRDLRWENRVSAGLRDQACRDHQHGGGPRPSRRPAGRDVAARCAS